MKTLFAIGFLVLAGIIANFLIVILLNIAGLPGSLLAGKPGSRSKKQFIAGSVVSCPGPQPAYISDENSHPI